MFSVYTPLVMVWSNSSVTLTFLSTFICLPGMYCVEMIAKQLDNPFGSYANNLPLLDYQMAMNKTMLLLLSPMAQQSPQLTRTAKRSFFGLISEHGKSGTVSDLSLMESEGSQHSSIAHRHCLLSDVEQEHDSLSCLDSTNQHDHTITQNHYLLSRADWESSQEIGVPQERGVDDAVDPAMVRQLAIRSARAANEVNQSSMEHCSVSCLDSTNQHDHTIIQMHCLLSRPDSESL